ncbi:MAG: toxin-antitoxin system HicB family antitoxin [Oligoflexia bacterium]|nr:toxin-antitoxin system HicB family antitoxin [Oligoflexia bacterium]
MKKKFDPRKYDIKINTFFDENFNEMRFYGRVTELKTIYVEESTANKAFNRVLEEIQIYKDHCEKHKIEFPLPLQDQEFSGELRLRLGKDLHKKVAVEANQLGVSINKYILEKLSA